MAFTDIIGRNWSGGGRSISSSLSFATGTGRVSIEDTVADSVNDKEIACAIDFSQIICLFILSTQDLTLETNNGAAPDDTINLKANQPYIWHTNSYDTNLITQDVTKLFLTNASGSSATFNLQCLYDASV